MAYSTAQFTLPVLHDLRFLKGQPIAPGSPATLNKILVVEVWTTTCQESIKIINHLTKMQEKFGHKLSLVGISTDENVDCVRDLLHERSADFEYTVAYDAHHSAKKWLDEMDLSSKGTPLGLLVVNNQVIGYGHPADQGFIAAVDDAVSKRPPTP